MKEPNRAPAYLCLYHGLCDIARRHGYALSIHGSVVSDLDLVAIPWTRRCGSAVVVAKALHKHIAACWVAHRPHEPMPRATRKPHGRRAWNLYLDYGAKVDLSVMPRRRV